jgi:serine/threonine-protein kinase PknG
MTAGTPCTATPDCPGRLDPDGFCDYCGTAAAPAVARTAATGAGTTGATGTATGPTPSGSVARGSVPSGSTPVDSAPTGSMRTAAMLTGSIYTGSGVSGRSGGTGSTRTGSRRRFGRGLVVVPPVAVADPAEAVLVDPQVPENKRYCSNPDCGRPVGRSRDGRPGRLTGFCPACRWPYSFEPKLARGDLVGGQYRIAGCLAHGGMGWVYLATDTRVADRWVVLKGLLDTGDAAAAEAAVAERRFLAEVEHPNTVKIFNFVEHGGAGYIVMEYVGGRSLRDVLKARQAAAGGPDPLPVAQAAAYLLDILPAFGYLHEHGLLYCDFKPDNVIQTADSVKLIDLGAVLRIGDADSAIFGTVGYQAPEIAADGPSVESDLYTVGRTLAVLSTDFRGYQNTYATSLPDPIDQPVFAAYPSLYWFLLRACHADARARFHSADEMADQLLGVLREALAVDGTPHPGPSTVFTAERATALAGPDRHALPVPLADLDDPNAAYLASVTVSDPAQLTALLAAAPADSPELGRRAVLALLDGADPAAAAGRLDTLVATWGRDWAAVWLAGLLALARDDAAAAQDAFEEVRAVLPGEPAPKLALAMCAELLDETTTAARWYDLVSLTDPAYTSASAGLGRVRAASGDAAGAVRAFDRIPTASAAWQAGQVAAVRALVAAAQAAGGGDGEADLVRAAGLLDGLPLPADEGAALRVELLTPALRAALANRPLPAAVLGGQRNGGPSGGTADEHRVRLALERAYRVLARTADGRDRIRLVDLANQVRPRTLT